LSRPPAVARSLNPERAFLVGLEIRRDSREAPWPLEESLAELAQLARTAGLQVAGSSAQKLADPNPATYVGPGKAEEIREQLGGLAIDTVIFDGELAPGQQRNLERLFGERVKVLDKSALILDIFAQHARTREGQLQVELAQYQYRLPRLTRLWTHLVRQAGGRAGGGAGGVGLPSWNPTGGRSAGASPPSKRSWKRCAATATPPTVTAGGRALKQPPWWATPTPARARF
jgi:GTP-binding protein HflX